MLVAAAVVLTAVVPAGAQQSAEAQLERAKERIASVGQEIEAAEGRVASSGTELAKAEEQLAEVEAVVNDLARQLDEQEGRVAEAQAELDRLRAENARVQARFDARVAAIYKGAGPRDLELVLASSDVEAVLQRSSFLSLVNTADSATLEDLRASRAQVQTQQERLGGEREFLERLKREQDEVLAQVAALRDSRRLALVSAQERVAELEREQDDLEESSKRLEEIIKQATGPAPVISAPSSGGYVWPLCGSVTSEYGRRWGRQHKGIDIDDNRTRSIVAAKSGTVIFAAYSGGYGNLILIQHGDGVVTAYAHQSSFAVGRGAQVSTGQRIGTVGSTGNSTGPHLHFETRVGGAAVNPRRYLTGGGC